MKLRETSRDCESDRLARRVAALEEKLLLLHLPADPASSLRIEKAKATLLGQPEVVNIATKADEGRKVIGGIITR
jgi:hypothetical protein